MWVFCKAGAGFSVRLLTSCDETKSSACGRSVSLSLSGWVFCEAVLAAVVERVGTFYKKNMVTANQLSASWKGTAATPNREGSGRSHPCEKELLQIVMGFGVQPMSQGFVGKKIPGLGFFTFTTPWEVPEGPACMVPVA